MPDIRVPEAIEAYTAHQHTLGLAVDTVKNQGFYLARFGKVCQRLATERGKRSPLRVSEIDGACITAYFATAPQGAGQGCRNNMLMPLKKFLEWCEMERYLPAGESKRLLAGRKFRTPERRPKLYVPPEQFGKLLDSATRHRADRMVMALAIYTLARQSEIAGLKLGNINLAEGVLRVYRVKKKRWTDVGISPELMGELVSWLEWYARELGYGTALNMMEHQPEWRLVPKLIVVQGRERGKVTEPVRYEMDPLSPQLRLEAVIKRGLDATGAITVTGKKVRHVGEGVHTIRRSGARAMFDYLSRELGSDRALVQVATMLDHHDTQVTLLYIGLDQEREQLNTWLKGNSMYGTGTPVSQQRLRVVRSA